MNRVAIVTGASRGIGAATAKVLAEQGYKVCVNYRSQQAKAEAVVEQIAKVGGSAIAVQADMADPEQVSAMFATVDEQLGTLSALVNNAGVFGPQSRVESLPREAMQQVLDVNVLGVIQCCQEAIKRMSTRHGGKGGAIVNVSSGSAYRGNAGSGVHYAISKGAVNSLTIGLSQEVAGEGIRVNAVSPGLTRTDMPSQERLDSEGPTIPIGRVGEPQEISQAIAWLLSEQASYVIGANIRVAGGRT